MSIDSTSSVTDTSLRQQRNKEIKKACQEFESVFTYELLKSMRQTVDKCDLFSGGEGEEIYESLLDQELSKRMTGYGSNSIAELLYRQLVRIDASSSAGQAADSKTDVSSRAVNAADSKTDASSMAVQTADSKTDIYSGAGQASDSKTDVSRQPDQEVYPEIQSEPDVSSTENLQPAWPMKSVISSKFGLRKDPFTYGNKFHSGIDIAADEGTEIKAALSGKVIMSCKLEDYGNVVAVDNGEGIVTLYAHNEKNLVNVGDHVEQGSLIAMVGSTGRSTGPHLHFEVRKDGTKIDPLKFLGVV